MMKDDERMMKGDEGMMSVLLSKNSFSSTF